MMLLFLVEENVFTFFHDFKSVNIDLGLDIFTSISCLNFEQQYTIDGRCTVRRVAYTISDGRCIVGDRVFGILPNGDVDFSKQISTRFTVYFASGDCEFSEVVYVPVGTTFSLPVYLEDVYGGVVRLDHYESDRFYVKLLELDVWMDSPVCTVDGCDEEVYQDGMCEECWEMWTLKTGAFDLGGE
tara:strand:- start:39 stop:593 length:555 start_codon:yes stop_codon:yes gene_type:complete